MNEYDFRKDPSLDKVYIYKKANVTVYLNSLFDRVKVDFDGVEHPASRNLDEVQEVSPSSVITRRK